MFGRQPAGEGPVAQGTRATTPQGTLNGPKDPPTKTQFGDAGERPNTEGRPRWWPHNPAKNITSPSGSRTEQLRTDWEQQVQPAPGRILRQMFERNRGVIGDDMMAVFPYDAAWSFIPHLPIPRKPMGVGPMPRMSDDNAAIPAVYAGNPRVRG